MSDLQQPDERTAVPTISTSGTLTPARLAEIEALAKAATPGPWVKRERRYDDGSLKDAWVASYAAIVGHTTAGPVPTDILSDDDYPTKEADAAYIAALDPQTVLALLADRAALVAECERLRGRTQVGLGVGDGAGNLFVWGDYESTKVCQDKLFELERLRRQLTTARAEAARKEREALDAALKFIYTETSVKNDNSITTPSIIVALSAVSCGLEDEDGAIEKCIKEYLATRTLPPEDEA